jgi:tRNA-specific 2-thiouridylase
MARERVLVAMSGGVDSAVAAARLRDEGFDVVGVTLHLWDYPEDGTTGRCCAPEDQYDARRTADALRFPHYSFDRRALFADTVVAPFVEAYARGETPSPCTTCNREVKLGELFRLAERLGARLVATGHYARIVRDAAGRPFVAAARDEQKDQSYFLYATPTWMLERLLFPLGESTKAEVRAEALARRLPGASKGESQELCFVGDGKGAYADFVESRAATRPRPGPIVDDEGRVVGHHRGVHRFTVGQRKGLGIALGSPAFVSEIDAATATVRVGPEDALASTGAALAPLHIAPGVDTPKEIVAKLRYRHAGVRAVVESRDGGGELHFLEPARAVARGQVAVLYDGPRVVGGGPIVAARRARGTGAREAAS